MKGIMKYYQLFVVPNFIHIEFLLSLIIGKMFCNKHCLFS